MFKRQIKTAVFLGILLTVLLVGWQLLPQGVSALPGSVRARLPQELLRLVTTPLPTALPMPVRVTAVAALEILPTLTHSSPHPTSPAPSSPTPTPLPRSSPFPTPLPPTPTTTPTPLPNTVYLDGLELRPQKLNNCGPTNVSMVLNFYGSAQDQFDVAGVVKPHYEDRNVSAEELVNYVNNYTELAAAVYRGSDLTLLQRLLSAGYPVIIEKGYLGSEWEGWMGHYLTLVGYDAGAQNFVGLDTFLGPWEGNGRIETFADIETHWHEFNQTFILIYPPNEAAAVETLLRPSLLEPTTMWQNAAQRARVELETNPDNAFTWANLGFSLTRLAQVNADANLYAQAAAAFDQALLRGLPPRYLWYQFELYAAYLGNGRFADVLTLTESVLENQGGRHVEETHYYRGAALQAAGDSAGARLAYQRALELKPDYPAAQTALATLQ